MDSIDKAITTLNESTSAAPWTTCRLDARCQILVTLAYLAAMLSVPLPRLEQLAWFAVYPILWSTLCGINYGTVFRRSLIVLPFVVFIGIFNPLLDRTVALTYGGIEISQGWITFTSIVVRGLLSVQAVVLLMINIGFVPMCRALGSMGLPAFMETQLMLLFRYMIVLLQEVQTMQRARESRSFGRKLSLRMWGVMIGQLFVRTVNRAERIHRAMVARGFSGRMRVFDRGMKLHLSDIAVTGAWIAAFIALRIVNIPQLLHFQ